ncbi:MAG: hypothetical protein WEB30_15380 [Cyclobacteriaceae bacterium]
MTFQPHKIEGSGSSHGSGLLSRQLYIDFDVYTEGDQEYKMELVLLLIDNLIEFRQTLTDSIQQNNSRLFLDACHKATVTLSMLEDKELNELIEELKRNILEIHKVSRWMMRLDRFQDVCDLIIISLRKEINGAEI